MQNHTKMTPWKSSRLTCTTIYTITKEKGSKLPEETNKERIVWAMGGVSPFPRCPEEGGKADHGVGGGVAASVSQTPQAPSLRHISSSTRCAVVSGGCADGMKRHWAPCEQAGWAHVTVSVCHHIITIFTMQTYCFCNWRNTRPNTQKITTDKLIEIERYFKDHLSNIYLESLWMYQPPETDSLWILSVLGCMV